MNDTYKTAFKSIVFILLVALIVLVISILMSSCRTIEVTKEVPVVTEHTTLQHHTDIVRDTLMMRDSVYHYVMGDTVIIERWHHTVNVNRVFVADTIRDTIPKVVTVTITKYVDKSKPPWHKRVLWGLGIGLIACVLVLFRKPLYSLIKKVSS